MAGAWAGSTAAAAWNKGYYPMADAVQIPESGWRSEEDKQAYKNHNFVLRGHLPGAAPAQGKVDWVTGDALTRPQWGAMKAYESFATDRAVGSRLAVTGARLGRTTIETSRGKATVPAWLFTLDGYSTPLVRVAVVPSELPKSPIGAVPQGASGGLRSLAGLKQTAPDGRSLTVGATHGACDDGPVVNALETEASVVLYASVKNPRNSPCTDVMAERNMTVELRRPLGDRVVLDALTGRPVPFGMPNDPSPTWT
ncbi:hypothetical protein [Streptomyces sp. 8L]|uniref:hypothetical protein n=1 Tax=Streptomyces sp. 8L TaxID=2877242 RepID=UPI001CD4ACE5|nr:hypothetical protein [Streptomyces sp. 8L]MCA1223147.1 hypothetical protein [Streptomyces sp. 8L]